MKFLIVGAGGHAKAIVEILRDRGHRIEAYVDPRKSDWLDVRHVAHEDGIEDRRLAVVLGIGGVTPAALARRVAILDRYLKRGFKAPPVVHKSVVISRTAELDHGTVALAGAILQPATNIGRAAIINTRALVEHDSSVGAGSHIAPGAVVLGGCAVGSCAMIGAGSVVLQGVKVPNRTIVKSTSLWLG
jgi:sugar O-acyltransferase (sialic acid O-acetyltransferase NeuD family)